MVKREKPEEVKLDHKGRRLTASGAEVPDPVPMAPPVGYTATESMFDIVGRMVRQHHAQIAGMDEFDSPEEADDFDVGDEDQPTSPYEFDAPADPSELERVRRALSPGERDVRGAAVGPSSDKSGSGEGGGAAAGGGSPKSEAAPADRKPPV